VRVPEVLVPAGRRDSVPDARADALIPTPDEGKLFYEEAVNPATLAVQATREASILEQLDLTPGS
jgi:hypothetical protein